MKNYVKPELEEVSFETEVITDITGSQSGEQGEDL